MSKGRRRKRRTTVLSFTIDGKMTEYRFTSKPDYSRILDEARADGIYLSIVFPGREPRNCKILTRLNVGDCPRSMVGELIRDMKAKAAAS